MIRAQEKRKDKETRKSWSEEKVVGFSSAPYSQQENGKKQKRKDKETRKSWSEDTVVGFSSASLFPTRTREAVTQGETIEPGG